MSKVTYSNGRQAIVRDYPVQSNIKELRLALGISQNELAIQAGVDRHSVIRSEQLCYPTPLPNITGTLSDITGIAQDVIETQYLADVLANRLNSGALFSNHQSLLMHAKSIVDWPNSDRHPFTQWRVIICAVRNLPVSRIYFSQLFSIHPATLDKYESYKTGFPLPVETAFRDAGFDDDLLNYLINTPAFNKTNRDD